MITSTGKIKGKLEPSYIATILVKSFSVSQKFKQLPYDPEIPLTGKFKSIQKICAWLFLSALFIKTKKTPNIHQVMNKQSVIYLYNGILFSNEKEWSTAICSNVAKP